MVLKVLELKNSSLPKEFIKVLPTHCICGAENEITESLTILSCPNRRCIEKSVQRLVALLKDLGVKNMGESKCRKFLEKFNLTNPYCIFMYEPSDGPIYDGASMGFSEEVYEDINTKRSMLLWEFIKIGNIHGIRDSARYIASGYNDVDELYEDIEDGGVPFIQSLLSIKGKGGHNTSDGDSEDNVSVKAVEVYSNLMFFKGDITDCIDYINVKSVNSKALNICISTSVGEPYKSKVDFIDQMRSVAGDKVHLNYLSAVTKDTDYLIWAKVGAPTSKVEKARKYGVKILTGIEFKNMLSTLGVD